MDQNTAVIIGQLAETLGTTTKEIVGHYVAWHIISAQVWAAVGCILFTCAFFIKGDKDGEIIDIPVIVFKTIIVVVAVLIISLNLVDLIAPEGIAIHQLIKDIRG